MNNSQRKALEKIIAAKLERQRQALDQAQRTAREQFGADLEKSCRAKAEELMAGVRRHRKEAEALLAQLEALGFHENYKAQLEVRLSDAQHQRIEDEYEAQRKRLQDAGERLTALAWGQETDFEALMKTVAKELA